MTLCYIMLLRRGCDKIENDPLEKYRKWLDGKKSNEWVTININEVFNTSELEWYQAIWKTKNKQKTVDPDIQSRNGS